MVVGRGAGCAGLCWSNEKLCFVNKGLLQIIDAGDVHGERGVCQRPRNRILPAELVGEHPFRTRSRGGLAQQVAGVVKEVVRAKNAVQAVQIGEGEVGEHIGFRQRFGMRDLHELGWSMLEGERKRGRFDQAVDVGHRKKRIPLSVNHGVVQLQAETQPKHLLPLVRCTVACLRRLTFAPRKVLGRWGIDGPSRLREASGDTIDRSIADDTDLQQCNLTKGHVGHGSVGIAGFHRQNFRRRQQKRKFELEHGSAAVFAASRGFN